jgi:hypothetical protein
MVNDLKAIWKEAVVVYLTAYPGTYLEWLSKTTKHK